jgi:hypothetical protein
MQFSLISDSLRSKYSKSHPMNTKVCWFSVTLPVYWLCVISFLYVGRNLLMLAIKVRCSPFCYQPFTTQTWRPLFTYTIYKYVDFARRKNKSIYVNQFFSFCDSDGIGSCFSGTEPNRTEKSLDELNLREDEGVVQILLLYGRKHTYIHDSCLYYLH